MSKRCSPPARWWSMPAGAACAAASAWWSLARRPVLFTLARALAEGWPGDVDRDALIARAFRTRRPDETHRARLRVEIGRLRALVAPVARIEASERGFALVPHGGAERGESVVLVPPIEGDEASLQALLADGAAWSTSALALALGESQRTVQRALADLEAAGKVRAIGRARSQRWLSAAAGRIHDDLVTPACAAACLECPHGADAGAATPTPGDTDDGYRSQDRHQGTRGQGLRGARDHRRAGGLVDPGHDRHLEARRPRRLPLPHRRGRRDRRLRHGRARTDAGPQGALAGARTGRRSGSAPTSSSCCRSRTARRS